MSLTTPPAATVHWPRYGWEIAAWPIGDLSFTSYYKLAKLPPFLYFPNTAWVSPTDIKTLLEERRKMGWPTNVDRFKLCWVEIAWKSHYSNCHNAIRRPPAIKRTQEQPPSLQGLGVSTEIFQCNILNSFKHKLSKNSRKSLCFKSKHAKRVHGLPLNGIPEAEKTPLKKRSKLWHGY